jgi:hypothetical protein
MGDYAVLKDINGLPDRKLTALAEDQEEITANHSMKTVSHQLSHCRTPAGLFFYLFAITGGCELQL